MVVDIDLVPQAYRQRRLKIRRLRQVAGTTGLVLAALLIGASALHIAAGRAKLRVADLQQDLAASEQQREEIARLTGERQDLERQLHLLAGLRSGADARDLFVAIDRALPDDGVWFLQWRFRRDGVITDDPARTVNTGYFIVVPEDEWPASDDRIQVQTQMTILGQASNHATLSRFVRNLFANPIIDDVRIRRTLTRPGDHSGIVDFDLAIVLRTEVERS